MTMRTTLCAAALATMANLPLAPTAAAQATPSVEVSGVLYPQFRVATDAASKAANAGNAPSRFDIERVYLTFRAPAGSKGSVRVTTDVFNNTTSCTGCYAGWNLRLKYAYFSYDLARDIGGRKGFNVSARLGMQQTAIIEHVEAHWPRWISSVAAERAGFFSSSDVGVASYVTLPRKLGEGYVGVANGSGYATAENDAFKDWSARLTLTPWGSSEGALKSVAISPWVYSGRSASKFAAAPGAAATDVADGLRKDRAGVFAGVRDRRLTAGAELGTRTETVESGGTLASRTTVENSGKLRAAFALVRPLELVRGGQSRFGILARIDEFSPYSNRTAAGAQTTSAKNRLTIFGAWWDLNARASFSLDVQHLQPSGGSTTAESRILFLHGQVSF